MTHYFNELSIEPKEILPGVFQQVISGREDDQKMMMVKYFIKEGAVFPQHSHPHEQHGLMVEGKAEFDIGGVKRIIGAGEGYVIPGGVEHGAVLRKDSIILDFFSPPREDFLK